MEPTIFSIEVTINFKRNILPNVLAEARQDAFREYGIGNAD